MSQTILQEISPNKNGSEIEKPEYMDEETWKLIPDEEKGYLELFAAIHRCKGFTAENAHKLFAGARRNKNDKND